MKKAQITNRVNSYVESVLNGCIPSCQMVKLAAQRWKDDWQREDLFYDERAVAVVYRMARHLKHYKGEKAGQYIRLEDWQLFIIANIFGWKLKETGKRRFRYADVFVPRKNGKTTLAAIIALAFLLLDGEAGAEIYAAAVDREQAKICFESSKELLKGSAFESLVEIYKGSIIDPENVGSYKPLSKETKNKDGLNPHAAVCDERHAWSTNEIYELLKTGMGARTQPLIFSISTAGMDTSAPYFSDLKVLEDVMRGIKKKDNHFILLYEPDEDDTWEDPTTWAKVNPNLGISLSTRYIQEEFEEAKMKGGTTLAAFLTKNLNMWVDAPDVWIADDDIKACYTDGIEDGMLMNEEAFAGLDFASKTDLVALSLYFPKFKTAKMYYLIPETKMRELEDKVDYRLWHEQGFIELVPGKVIEEEFFISWLLSKLAMYKIRCLAYDPWGMWSIAPKLTRYSDVLMEYQQNIRYMSVPTKEIEGLVLRHDINLMNNPILRWNFSNVVVYQDANANVKLDKQRSRNKIDGVVALVDAYGGFLNKKVESEKKEIYTNHGLRTISSI